MKEYIQKIFATITEWQNTHPDEDYPTFKSENGDLFWYKDDVLHREDGPVVICANGDIYWYRNGEQHRSNGHAVEYSNGNIEYWLNNIQYSDEEYWKKVNPYKEMSIGEIQQLLDQLVDIIAESYENI